MRLTSTAAHILLACLFLFGCSGGTIEHEEWSRMSREDKVLYVRSLIGAEKVKERKGGNLRTYSRDAEEYATKIDEAFARGDTRTTEQIFAELADR